MRQKANADKADMPILYPMSVALAAGEAMRKTRFPVLTKLAFLL